MEGGFGRGDTREKKASKIEEDLEIKALRRIISAYLNYSVAAEEDVKRWERSYAKLSLPHMALLVHVPNKYQQLRRCIAANSFFILNMLQAFEPPFDMGQDSGSCEYGDMERHTDIGDHSQKVEYRAEYSVSKEQHPSAIKEFHSTFTNDGMPNYGSPQLSSRRDEAKVAMATMSGESESIPNICGSREMEACDNQSRSHSVSAADGEANRAAFDWKDPAFQLHVPPADVEKVRCIVRNIVRDWAPEGELEREQCYKPILDELQRHFWNRSSGRPPSCLVPGAGLARLALEISRLGFVSQGNEFSYYMMMCSNFILNHTQAPMEWVIYPWIHSNCNSLSDKDQLRPVYFPDLHPGSAGITEGFSMCAGDFVEVYNDPSQSGAWDAVATCFFIDTAHNVVEYIEIISKVLKDGGVWINLGPLLYHFADTYAPEDEMSIELSLEDVKRIAFHYGFELETERTIETTYTANLRSMMQNRYFAAFWTMRKKGSTA